MMFAAARIILASLLVLMVAGCAESKSEFDLLLEEYQQNWDNAPSDYNIQICMAWQVYGPQGFREASVIAVSGVEWEALKALLREKCR
jgi:hypothetical protein